MKFIKKSLNTILLSACANSFVFATSFNPSDYPYFFTRDYTELCSDIGAGGFIDVTNAVECEFVRTLYVGSVLESVFGNAIDFLSQNEANLPPACYTTNLGDGTIQIIWNDDGSSFTNPDPEAVISRICKNTNFGLTNSGGDPHFIGFNQQLVTYQGECTLVLMDSPAATATGEDVVIHVRTTRKLDFSYISGVAMKIGDDIIEAKPNGDIMLNGQNIISTSDESVTMSGLPFVITKEKKGTKKLIVSYSFDLGNGRVINVQANKKRSMMFVRTTGIFPAETTGMLGSPKVDSEMVSRDGRKLSEIDVNTYGESWQVKDTDVQLFQELMGPQYPQKCMYDDAPGATAQLRGRRKLLAKKVVTVDEARAACAGMSSVTKRELCVQDTIAMGDLDMKDDPFYTEE
eukprot:CAMPEP_0176492872 /NCGR_PEP_ID=MMETSP0200_2-20121128/9249_1 /TAXON_ID=947934 /ORGANISM="Chaetoceros sp., Strain GSL56" /LENGTH=402 /DNA_ID=CAMNT_0017890501 /DNA_START=57 /DNA_END=1265 /DNA_ORIENTATION=+